MSMDRALAYWRAVGLLRVDHALGLRELEMCFNAGATPNALDGRLRGRLLATTVGKGLDGLFEAATRLWMPWLGKSFDHANGDGRNLFTAGAGRLMRYTLPRYPDLRAEDLRQCSAFVFRTSTGPSALGLGVKVLRIDYRDVPENPSWPIRRILDELVAVDDGRSWGRRCWSGVDRCAEPPGSPWRGSTRRW